MRTPRTAYETKTLPAREPLPDHAEVLHSPDGAVELGVSPWGGQVMRGEISGRAVILPLAELHSISTDRRYEATTEDHRVLGETTAPGGTWISFGGGTIIEKDGTKRDVRIHGAAGAPWYRYHAELVENGVVLTGGARGTEAFFRRGEAYAIRREVYGVAGDNHREGTIALRNTFMNVSEQAAEMPEAVEHSYFVSNDAAAILDATSMPVSVADVQAIRGRTEKNPNVIDTRFNTELTGTPGICVFLPEGPDGHVVVIDAASIGPDGARQPIETFCLYRAGEADQWTAVEPAMSGIYLDPGVSVTMDVAVSTFPSLAAYEVSRATPTHAARHPLPRQLF